MFEMLHPQIIERDGNREFVVLPYDEYVKVEEALETLHDIELLQGARMEHAGQTGTFLREAGARLGF